MSPAAVLLPALLAALLFSALAGASAPQPAEAVEGFHDDLLETMRAELPFSEREQRLHPAVAARFDLTTIARISLGAAWRELDAAQRQQVIEALHALVAATYADRFKRYNGHRFVTRSVDDAGGGRSRVRAELHRVDGATVRLDYFLVDGLIFNVVADGVSDLALRRAEYGSILRDDGVEALLRNIRQKTAEYRATDAG